jgi:hypothetical protein
LSGTVLDEAVTYYRAKREMKECGKKGEEGNKESVGEGGGEGREYIVRTLHESKWELATRGRGERVV